MTKIDRVEAFGTPKGTWVWCLHCEQAYQVGEYRLKGDLQMCPYEGCTGDTVMDAWEWKQIRRAHPEYPKIPERNKVYLKD